MTAWDRILIGGLWGAGLGSVLLSVLALLWWAVFAPNGLKDGQFGMLFFLFTIPFGALLGAAAGVARVLLGLHARETAGWVCIAGGCVVAGLSVWYVLFLTRDKGLAHLVASFARVASGVGDDRDNLWSLASVDTLGVVRTE